MHKHINPCLYFNLLSVVVIFITVVLVFSFKSSLNNAYAESPFFSPQEMSDPYNDWKVRLPGNKWIPAPDGNNNADLLAINYFSEGQFLNSTLWLNGPIGSPPNNGNEDRAYGMLIDSDSNNKTGWQGIEYQVEINGENGIWNRTIQQWSPTGETRILSNTTNLADFKFSNENKNYVILDVDLNKYLISPHRYKVLFYAEERKSDLDIPIFDFSNWITIPPPNFAISISPNPVVVRQGGEDSIATIKINSTTGRESEVHLSPFYKGSKINLSFDQPHLHIPSYGMATSNIHVSSKTNDVGEYPISIFVNSTFAKEGIDLGKQTNMIQQYYSSHANNFMIPDFIPIENVMEQSTLIVKVDKPFSPNEQFKNWINDWFNPVAAIITPIVSAVSGILGWKIGSSNSKKKQDKTTTEDKDEKKNGAKENSKR